MELCGAAFDDSMEDSWVTATRKPIPSCAVNSQQDSVPVTMLAKEQQRNAKANATFARARNDEDDDDDDDDDDDNDVKDEEDGVLKTRDDDVDEDDDLCSNKEMFQRREASDFYGDLLGSKAVTSGSTRKALTSIMRGVGRRSSMRAKRSEGDESSSTHMDPEIGAVRIHCLVDHVREASDFSGAGSYDVTEVEQEDDVTVTGDTLLADLVQVALTRLGYDLRLVMGAQGAIQLKSQNWKPLPFDVITDDKTATVHDVLGDGTGFILRLRLPRKSEEGQREENWRDSSVRHAVLCLLQHLSQAALAKLSPLSQSTISTIANRQYKNRLSFKKCQAFGRWYSSYVGDIAKDFTPKTPNNSSRVAKKTTFHPVTELPLLRSWFHSFPTPTPSKFNMFAHILNNSQVRHERPNITPQKIRIWWRNERQRLKHKQQQQQQQQPTSPASRKKSAKGKKESSPKTSTMMMIRPASQCKRKNVPVARKQNKKTVTVQGTKSAAAGAEEETSRGLDRQDVFRFQRPAFALKNELSQLCGGREEGEVVDIPCISSSTDHAPSADSKPPALVPGSPSSDAEMPHQGARSPSPPPVPQPLPHSSPFAKTLSRQARKNPDMSFTLQGQGHALLSGGQAPASWQSSFMSWSSHRKSVQDMAATVSAEPPAFLLPAWQQYLPFVVPCQDRSRSEAEQEVISSSSGCSFEEVERYRYSQDLPFGLPSSHF